MIQVRNKIFWLQYIFTFLFFIFEPHFFVTSNWNYEFCYILCLCLYVCCFVFGFVFDCFLNINGFWPRFKDKIKIQTERLFYKFFFFHEQNLTLTKDYILRHWDLYSHEYYASTIKIGPSSLRFTLTTNIKFWFRNFKKLN